MPSASSSKGQLYPDSLSTPTAYTHIRSSTKARSVMTIKGDGDRDADDADDEVMGDRGGNHFV
jgi:hypothetical protein